VYALVKEKIGYFLEADGVGVPLLVYSVLLTKGIA